MMNFRFKKILNLLIVFSYSSAIFLLPIFFAVFPRTNNVFELNKIVLFKILTLSLFLSSFLKIVFYPEEKVYFRGVTKHLRRKKSLFFAFLLAVLSLMLSTYFSINHQNSIFGLYDRQAGLGSLFFYFIFFILLLFNLRSKAQIKNAVRIVVFSSFFVAAYGLAQATGHDPYHWIESTKSRITSTFGQPNTLSAYILLVYPFSIYLFFSAKNYFAKITYLAVFVLLMLNLFFTYSISGWIGFGVSLAVFVFLYLKNKTIPFKRFFEKDMIKKSLIFFSAVFILFFAIINIYNANYLKSKIGYLVNPQGGSTAARIDFWQASLKAIKERPIFGYGLENQGEIISRYYAKDWGVPSDINVIPNRAHNLFLDILLTGGFFGLVAYLFLLYVFLKIILRNIKENKSRYLNYAILASLAGYLASLQFNFSFVVGQAYFCLILAIVLLSDIGGEESVLGENKNGFPLIGKIIFSVLSLALAGIVAYSVNFQLKTLIADHYFLEIRQAELDNYFFKSLTLFDYIKELKIRDLEYKRKYSKIIIDWIPRIDQYGLVFRMTGEKVVKEILGEIDGNSRDDYLTRAYIYTFLAGEENKNYYDSAEENFNYLIKNYPEMPIYYYNLANMLQKKGDYDRAIENFSISLDKLPSLNDPNLNPEHKKEIESMMFYVFLGLGDAYLSKNDFEQSGTYFLKALDLNPKIPLIYEKLSSYSKIKGDMEEAINYNLKARKIWEYDYAWPFAIAKLYKETGDYKKAKEYGEIASGLNSEDVLIKDFLNSLDVR